jgi:hypothetical protein
VGKCYGCTGGGVRIAISYPVRPFQFDGLIDLYFRIESCGEIASRSVAPRDQVIDQETQPPIDSRVKSLGDSFLEGSIFWGMT